MTDVETLAERVRTVERAVTDGDHTFPAVDDVAALTDRLDTLERRVDELDDRTTELEGATQALRGYVGNVRSVNERVEQRADTALAATERLERRLDDLAGDRPTERHSTERRERAGGATPEPAGQPDIGTPSAGSADKSDEDAGAPDAGVLERIRSLL